MKLFAELVERPSPPPSQIAVTEPLNIQRAKGCVLVIDDNQAFQNLIETSFSIHEVKVFSALSGREGVNLLIQNRGQIDCVYLDFQLPGINGLEVLKRLRDIDSNVPIIFMTGFGDAETARLARGNGANDYLAKPVSPAELLHVRSMLTDRQINPVVTRSERIESVEISSASRIDTQAPAGFSREIQDATQGLISLLEEIDSDLTSLERHISSWNEKEQAIIEQAFVAQVELDYFPLLDESIARFESAADTVTHTNETQVIDWFRQILHPILVRSPFMERVIKRPIGVPGDYSMLGQILGNAYRGQDLFGRTLNAWILQTNAADAYRHRVSLLDNYIDQAVQSRADRVTSILSVGSGVAYEIQRLLASGHKSNSKIEVTLVDFSPETLVEAQRLIELCLQDSPHPENYTITIREASILELLSLARSENLADPLFRAEGYELVYCTGLFDYLSDRVCQQIIKYLQSHTSETGRAIVSNYTPENPIRRFMDLALDWQLIYRDASSFDRMVKDAALNPLKTNTYTDPSGVEVYSVIGN